MRDYTLFAHTLAQTVAQAGARCWGGLDRVSRR